MFFFCVIDRSARNQSTRNVGSNNESGSGQLGISSNISAGILVSALLGAMATYCTYMYISSGSYWRKSLLEHQWTCAFGPTFMPVIVFLSIIVTVLRHMACTADIVDCIQVLVHSNAPGASVWVTDQQILILAVVIILAPSFGMIRSLKPFVMMSAVSCGIFIAMTVYLTYWVIKVYNDFGFDPNGEASVFKADLTLLSCVRSLIGCYQFMPVAWPRPRHLKNSMPNRLLKVYGIALAVSFFFNTVRQVMTYVAFGGAIMDVF